MGWGSQNGAGGVGQPPPTSPWALEYLIHQQMMTQTLPISLRRVLENAKLEKMLKRLTQQLQGFCGGGGGMALATWASHPTVWVTMGARVPGWSPQGLQPRADCATACIHCCGGCGC